MYHSQPSKSLRCSVLHPQHTCPTCPPRLSHPQRVATAQHAAVTENGSVGLPLKHGVFSPPKTLADPTTMTVQDPPADPIDRADSIGYIFPTTRGEATAATQQLPPLAHPAAGFSSIPDALEAMRNGQPVVVLDDESRENEGDLIMAADVATQQSIAFFINHTSGIICVSITSETAEKLELPLMVSSEGNSESMSTAFTVSVDSATGTTTGISANDRATTILALSNPETPPQEFRRPGHVFPLIAKHGGVLTRPGHTEAALDLSVLAGCGPTGVLCEVVNEDGTMARTKECLAFARQHGLACITIADLIRYRAATETFVRRVSGDEHLLQDGGTARVYCNKLSGEEHVAVVQGHLSHGWTQVQVHEGPSFGDWTRGGVGQRQDGKDTCVHVLMGRGQRVGLESQVAAAAQGGQLGRFDDVRDALVVAGVLKDLAISHVDLHANHAAHVKPLANWLRLLGFEVQGGESL